MNFYNYTLKMLQDYFVSFGENPAKAKIVFSEVYKKKITSFYDIKILSEPVLKKLDEDFSLEGLELLKTSESKSTVKFLFKLSDGYSIETVVMKHDYGNGVCVSTQVGCNMDCAFCESGKLKKIRNLEAYEIVGQLLYVKDTLNIPVSHVVLMGIGEPFDNYESTMNFIDIITDQAGISLPHKHITISTSGITPKIKEYSKRKILNGLAISLHAPTNELRDMLMPINKAYPINELINAAKDYARGNKKITFAYIMLKDINDSDECAYKLAELLKDINCYVNIIPYNKTPSADFEPSSRERISAFFDILKKQGLNVTVRREFGGELDAACGQLAVKHIKEKEC